MYRGYYRGSGYGYGTVPGGRWSIDTEGGHVVDSVSRKGCGYGSVCGCRGDYEIMNTEMYSYGTM